MATYVNQEVNRVMSALQSGQLKTAHSGARTLTRSHPKEAYFHNLEGLILARMGKERQAIPCFQKAIKLDPSFAESHKNLAQALFVLGMHDKAQTLMVRHLKTQPKDSDALYLLAMSQTRTSDLNAAEATATRAIAAGGNPGRAYNLRGIIRRNIDELPGALEDFEAALKHAPDNPDILSNYSFSLAMSGRTQEAFEELERARKIAPEHEGVLLRYAGTLNQMGRTEEAIASYKQILDRNRDNVAALCSLANLQSSAENAELLPRITALHARIAKNAPERVELAFALWDLHRRAGDLTEAEKWLVSGNAGAAALRPFNIKDAEDFQRSILALLPSDKPLASNTDDSGPRPIFVLGMIRSGTTLTEQIISAHSQVHGAGEITTAGHVLSPYIENATRLNSADLAEIARQYRTGLPALPEGTIAFTDKMPGNFRLIGILLAAMPDCRIINLVRDPRDTALSIYSNNFPAPGLSYTNDLKATAGYFNLYRRTMNHWNALYPGQILNLDYADIVQDVEATSHRLAEFCGLPWEPAMARPEKNLRPIMTASVNQVRAGVHTKSLAGWRKHAKMLQPFIDALDPELWPELAE